MATKQKTPSEEAIEAYEETVKSSHRVSVTEALAVRALLRKYEFTYVDPGNGSVPVERVDNDAIKRDILEVAQDHLVGPAKEDRTDKPIHRFLVTGALLKDEPVPPPYGDADAWDALDALAHVAWHKAEQHIWKLIDHKYSGTLQRWVRETLNNEDTHLVLVKADDYLFITTEAKYVEAEILRKITDKSEVALVAAGEQAGLFTRQLPALKGRAPAALRKAAKQAGEKALAAYTLRAAEENGNGEE
jgi:hypothetical protein